MKQNAPKSGSKTFFFDGDSLFQTLGTWWAIAYAPALTGLMCLFFSVPVRAAEYLEETEKTISLRSNGTLQVLNNRGDIVIEGWSQDKIRVKLKKKTTADDPSEAKHLLASAAVQHRIVDGGVEISAEYGHGLTLQERLQERDNPKTVMEMTLSAPAHSPLQILALKGKVILRQWRGSVEIRSGSGEIQIENIKGKGVFVLCPSCSIQVTGMHAPLRCVGGDRAVTLNDVDGDQIYIQTDSGEVRGQDIRGEQLYVSKTGAVTIQRARGHIEFYTREAGVDFSQISGSLSGRTISGNITAKVAKWIFNDKALIESARGNILLGLPHGFSGELDILAMSGMLTVDPSIDRMLKPFEPKINVSAQETPMFNKPPSGRRHLTGAFGGGGEQLKIISENGSVRLTLEK